MTFRFRYTGNDSSSANNCWYQQTCTSTTETWPKYTVRKSSERTTPLRIADELLSHVRKRVIRDLLTIPIVTHNRLLTLWSNKGFSVAVFGTRTDPKDNTLIWRLYKIHSPNFFYRSFGQDALIRTLSVKETDELLEEELFRCNDDKLAAGEIPVIGVSVGYTNSRTQEGLEATSDVDV